MNNKISLWVVLVATPVALVIGLVSGWGIAATIAGSEARNAADRYALLQERHQTLEAQQRDVLKLYEAAKEALEAASANPNGEPPIPSPAPEAGGQEPLSDAADLLNSYSDVLKQFSELADALGG